MREGTPLWEPPAELREHSALARFMRAQGHDDYAALWQWSIDDLEGFWAAIWDWCGVRASQPYERVLGSHEMPGA
ncbi:MAG TPA: acetyl-coenzyme A synthetase N-terminal domain-containing protein, partial [Thermoleophilaceae bacterium]